MDLNFQQLPSTSAQPCSTQALLTKVSKKRQKTGRILGPFDSPPLPNLRCSGLGAIPKHDGGWRIIYHLSAPTGSSINDFIDANTYTLTYCTVDDAYTIFYYIYKAEKPSVRPSAVFWSRGSPPWMQGLTSNLHETKRLSSGITKFIFKS